MMLSPLLCSRRLVRWLLAAMLLAALAPAVSRTLASTRAAGDAIELCTASGMRWVSLQASEGDAQREGELQHALDACGHCGLAAERFAPLPPSPPLWATVCGTWAVPRYQATVQHAPDAPSPGARGPPLLS